MENKLGDFLRKKRGTTSLREFAKKLKISHTYLDSIEKGFDPRTKKPVRITVDTLSDIAVALDEPFEKLASYSKNEDYVDLTKKDNFIDSKMNDFKFAYHKEAEGLTEEEISDALRFYKEMKKRVNKDK